MKDWKKQYNIWKDGHDWKQYSSRDKIDDVIVNKLSDILDELEDNFTKIDEERKLFADEYERYLHAHSDVSNELESYKEENRILIKSLMSCEKKLTATTVDFEIARDLHLLSLEQIDEDSETDEYIEELVSLIATDYGNVEDDNKLYEDEIRCYPLSRKIIDKLIELYDRQLEKEND